MEKKHYTTDYSICRNVVYYISEANNGEIWIGRQQKGWRVLTGKQMLHNIYNRKRIAK